MSPLLDGYCIMYKENLHFLSHLVTHVKNAMMQGSRKNAILAIAHILRRSVLKMNLLVFVPYFFGTLLL